MLFRLDRQLFIFYRLLRPEFVRNRGRKVLDRLKLPAGHKFPTVKVTNPMMFAITFARSAAGGGGPKRGKKAAIKDKPSSSAPRCARTFVRCVWCDTAARALCSLALNRPA